MVLPSPGGGVPPSAPRVVQRLHLRSKCGPYFDSKACLFFDLTYVSQARPSCIRRRMWASLCHVASIRLAQFYQGGQMLAVTGRKTVAALSRAIWERKARTMPTKKVGNVPGLFAYSGIRMPGSFFAKKAVSTTRQSSPNFINANKKKTRERAQICALLFFFIG